MSTEAPEGWYPFGSHTTMAVFEAVGEGYAFLLEYSEEQDEDGFPLWERPVQQ